MFKIEDASLVVVDVQGKLATLVDESESMIQNISKLVQAMHTLNVPVICLEQNPSRLGNTHPEILQHLQTEPIAKIAFNACLDESFIEAIEASGRSQLIIAGIETHICIYQTARNLKEHGFTVEVVEDAVSSRTKENKRIALTKLQALGVLPTSTEMILYELLQRADHDQFKTILKLVK